MELLDEFFAGFEGGQVSGCGDLRPQSEARSDILAVLGAAGRETSGLLVVMGGFGPSDLVSGVFGFFQERQRDFPDPYLWGAEGVKRFREDGTNFIGNYIKEKFFRNAEGEFLRFRGQLSRRTEIRLAFDAWQDGFEE